MPRNRPAIDCQPEKLRSAHLSQVRICCERNAYSCGTPAALCIVCAAFGQSPRQCRELLISCNAILFESKEWSLLWTFYSLTERASVFQSHKQYESFSQLYQEHVKWNDSPSPPTFACGSGLPRMRCHHRSKS